MSLLDLDLRSFPVKPKHHTVSIGSSSRRRQRRHHASSFPHVYVHDEVSIAFWLAVCEGAGWRERRQKWHTGTDDDDFIINEMRREASASAAWTMTVE